MWQVFPNVSKKGPERIQRSGWRGFVEAAGQKLARKNERRRDSWVTGESIESNARAQSQRTSKSFWRENPTRRQREKVIRHQIEEHPSRIKTLKQTTLTTNTTMNKAS